MIGSGLARERRRWRERARHEQVEVSTRWMMAVFPWSLYLSGLVQVVTEREADTPSTVLATAAMALGAWECSAGQVLLRPALDHYLATAAAAAPAATDSAGPGLRLAPRLLRGTVALVAATVAQVGLSAALAAADGTGKAVPAMTLFASLGAPVLILGIVLPRRTALLGSAGLSVLSVAVFAATGLSAPGLVGSGVAVAGGAFCGVLTGRGSAWYIAVMRELDETRDVQARLAVAEERLRFGRDLHDVLGRNLAVIALKSELAAQLAQRGAAAAVDQMAEVQRIARDSQSEVREVVRGYRETGLGTELTGARGILRAAGVDCRVEGEGEGAGLPGPVQSALGWVVREGATNVLRHAEAKRCAVRVRVVPEAACGPTALLVMENDGAGATAGSVGGGSGDGAGAGAGAGAGGKGGGSGLAGLRERLAALGGTLAVERGAGDGVFRLLARVPLGGDEDDGARRTGAVAGGRAGTGDSPGRSDTDAAVGGRDRGGQ